MSMFNIQSVFKELLDAFWSRFAKWQMAISKQISLKIMAGPHALNLSIRVLILMAKMDETCL